MPKRPERLLQGTYCFSVRGAGRGPLASLLQISRGLLPDFAAERVVREALDLLGLAAGIERFDRLHDPRVQSPPALLEQAPVGHLVRQRMLEGVFEFGKQARFVQELGGLEMRQALAERCFGDVSDGLQERPGDLGADHSRGLQETLLVQWQAVDPCRQDRLHGGG
jgi:hypothetical protein